MKDQEVITLQRARSFLVERLCAVLGSANYSLGPAFQLLYRQGKLLPAGTAEPSCSRLFSRHCDCNLRQNIILLFFTPRRKAVTVGGKRHTYFGSKATKKTRGICQPWEESTAASPDAAPPQAVKAISISRLQPPPVCRLPEALRVPPGSTMSCNGHVLSLPEDSAGNCPAPNEVCPLCPQPIS